MLMDASCFCPSSLLVPLHVLYIVYIVLPPPAKPVTVTMATRVHFLCNRVRPTLGQTGHLKNTMSEI